MLKKIKIKDKIWKVKHRSNLKDDDGGDVYGICVFEDREIFIRKGLSPEMHRLTLLHEFLHASLYELHICIDRDLEETIVDGLATVLLDTFDVTKKYRPKIKK